MKKYIEMELEVITFTSEDVITASQFSTNGTLQKDTNGDGIIDFNDI